MDLNQKKNSEDKQLKFDFIKDTTLNNIPDLKITPINSNDWEDLEDDVNKEK